MMDSKFRIDAKSNSGKIPSIKDGEMVILKKCKMLRRIGELHAIGQAKMSKYLDINSSLHEITDEYNSMNKMARIKRTKERTKKLFKNLGFMALCMNDMINLALDDKNDLPCDSDNDELITDYSQIIVKI